MAAGPDPALLALGHDDLAGLVRESLLGGHLIDRASMPHIIGAWGREEMRDIAIDEWMGASPIYTRRMQRLLGFVGDDVATIFKGMQFDVGAPPQFMDFRYSVTDELHGEFWLDHCGALMDVEPMGDEYVFTMCHEIEDPTFDATACATNPRARMRPIHRPPRVPADRHPHCAWTVTIEPEAHPLPEPEMAVLMAATRAGRLPLTEIVAADDAGTGAGDYAGPLVADVDFAGFTTAVLHALYEEVALQWQLVSLSGLMSIEGRYGYDAAASVGRHQLVGVAGLTAARMRDQLELGSALADAAHLLELHPVFRPRSYVALDVTVDAQAGCVTLDLADCEALEDPSGLAWARLLADGGDTAAVDVIVQAVDPRMRASRVPTRDGYVASFDVVVGDTAAEVHQDVVLARFSTGTNFEFRETPVVISPR